MLCTTWRSRQKRWPSRWTSATQGWLGDSSAWRTGRVTHRLSLPLDGGLAAGPSHALKESLRLASLYPCLLSPGDLAGEGVWGLLGLMCWGQLPHFCSGRGHDTTHFGDLSVSSNLSKWHEVKEAGCRTMYFECFLLVEGKTRQWVTFAYNVLICA